MFLNELNLFNLVLKQSLSKTNNKIYTRKEVFLIILRRFEMSIDSSSKDISIVLCGEAGQGIQTVETILVKAIKKSGYNVFSTKEYMSRVRGGENSTEIRVSSKRVFSYVDRIDILLALSEGAVPHLENRITSNTLIMGDEKHLKNFSNR